MRCVAARSLLGALLLVGWSLPKIFGSCFFGSSEEASRVVDASFAFFILTSVVKYIMFIRVKRRLFKNRGVHCYTITQYQEIARSPW
jgi:uncharacterized membrane protein YobD (UPF0266 family)